MNFLAFHTNKAASKYILIKTVLQKSFFKSKDDLIRLLRNRRKFMFNIIINTETILLVFEKDFIFFDLKLKIFKCKK